MFFITLASVICLIAIATGANMIEKIYLEVHLSVFMISSLDVLVMMNCLIYWSEIWKVSYPIEIPLIRIAAATSGLTQT